MYPEFMQAMGVDTAGRKEIVFDAGSKKYMDNFMKYAHKESDDMGVAFWWLDWQQDFIYPVVRGTNMLHLSWLNHLYYNYSARNNMRGAGFSRWGGWGNHRYPIQFSGDAYANWDVLAFEVELTATSGNVGCFFWAHDIGGFYGGTDPELYARWTQFGLLNSSLRIHSTRRVELDRRMWLWGEETEIATRKVYHLRAQLMPYIYSSVWQCHDLMLPLIRAMYIEYPETPKAYENPQQFLFGDVLLGAPITSAGEGEDKNNKKKVWFPEGDIWYNFFTGQKYEGGSTTDEKCDLNTFPLYVKGGYPLPMQPYTPRMASAPLTQLVVRCYPGEVGANNTYTLYEDDGITRGYETGKQAFTKMEYKKEPKTTTITIYPVSGSYEGQVKKRSYTFQLPEISDPINPTVNGKRVKAIRDESIHGYVVEVSARGIEEKVVLSW
jgi:alpha-glucosidase (family GH31 glycosyl hydrolase)